MLARNAITSELSNPVAIYDKELATATSFTLQTFELCTQSGATFGIGYHGGSCQSGENIETGNELPRRSDGDIGQRPPPRTSP